MLRNMRLQNALSVALILFTLTSVLAGYPAYAATPSIKLKPTSGPTGSDVTITGASFPLSDTSCDVSTTSDSNFIASGAACSIFKGKVTGSFVVGNVDPGQYVVEIDSSPSGLSAQAVFTVTSGPFIQLFPSSGPTGTHVTIEGTYFLPSDNPCSLSSPTDSSAVVNGACSFFTVRSGKFKGLQNVTGSFVVGNVPPGDYVIQVDGSLGDFAQAIFTVTAGPSLHLHPSSGPTGIHVTIEGTGFQPGDNPCSLSSPTSGDMVVDGACSFFTVKSGHFKGAQNVTGSFVVGNVPPGDYVIQVDGSLGDFAQAIFTVRSGRPPTITLSKTSGPSGVLVTVSGSQFSTFDAGTCTISSSSDIVASPTCTVTSAGKLTGSFFTVGPVMAGPYVITVQGSTGDSASATFTVTGPAISLSPSSGPFTALVTVSGNGFSTGDEGTCTILQTTTSSPNNVVTNPTCTVTSEGQLTGSYFTVGQVAAGNYVITVQGGMGDSASAIFKVTNFQPKIKLSVSSGPGGTVVSVSGSGFNPADYCNSASFSSSPLGLMSATSCSMVNGQIIAASFTIAHGLKAGKYTVILTASTLDSAEATFTVT